MKYYVTVTTINGDEFMEIETYCQAEAIQAARNAYRYLTSKERQKSTIEVRVYDSYEHYLNAFVVHNTIEWKDNK